MLERSAAEQLAQCVRSGIHGAEPCAMTRVQPKAVTRVKTFLGKFNGASLLLHCISLLIYQRILGFVQVFRGLLHKYASKCEYVIQCLWIYPAGCECLIHDVDMHPQLTPFHKCTLFLNELTTNMYPN